MAPILTLVVGLDFAGKIAREIHDAIKEHKDSRRREIVDGVDRAVRFRVTAPSLGGKSLKRLRDGGMSFDQRVGMADRCGYCVANGYSGSAPVLGIYHFKLIIEDGVYTGEVIVWQRSCDYAH